jgi:hypothetical protein
MIFVGLFTDVYIASNLLAEIGFDFFVGNVKSKFYYKFKANFKIWGLLVWE